MTPTLPQLPTSPGLKTLGSAGGLLSSLTGKSIGESFDSLISRAVSSGGAKSKSSDSDGQTPTKGEAKMEPNTVASSLDAASILGAGLTVPVIPPVAMPPVFKAGAGAISARNDLKILLNQAPTGQPQDMPATVTTTAAKKAAEAQQGTVGAAGQLKLQSEQSLMTAIKSGAVKEPACPDPTTKVLGISVSNAAMAEVKVEVAPSESKITPDAKGLAELSAKGQPRITDSTVDNAAKIDSTNAGTPIAKLSAAMKKPEQTNRIAGATGNFLPGSVASPGAKFDLLVQAGNISANAVGAVQANTDSGRSIVTNVVLVPADAGARMVERTQEMVVQHAMRLNSSTADSLQVVIKPGAGTQLSLELRQRGDAVEVQAVLQQGDFNQLNQNWGDLQQQLQQRGIQLGALLDGNDLNGNGEAQLQQGQSGDSGSLEDETPVLAAAGGSAHVSGGLMTNVPGSTSVNGWQTWA